MRAKNILTVVPVPNVVKLMFGRFTVSHITLFYFSFSLVYCVLQLIFQIWAFKINNDAGIRLTHIIGASTVVADAAVFSNGRLSLCRPDYDSSINECPVVWDAHKSLNDTDYSTVTAPTPFEVNATPTSTSVSTSVSTSTSTSTSSTVSASTVSSAPPSVALSPVTSISSVRSTGIVTFPIKGDDDDDDEKTTRGKQNKTITQFTKRSDGIIRINKDNVIGVFIPDLSVNGEPGVVLSDSCVQLLVWPAQKIRDTKREDLTFIAFQAWVMGMSVVALLNESIPHIIAAFITHLLATGWSAFQIYNTHSFGEDFVRFANTPDRCKGVNVLPSYWSKRNAAEIAVLSINAVFLITSLFFTFRLVKSFGWRTYKRIGASLVINRVYKLVLMFSIGLQLALFFVLASMGLWLDFIINTTVGQRAARAVLYKTMAIMVCILMIPWMYLGWTAVRKESKVLMGIFIFVSTALLSGWGGMFASTTFRWDFLHWSFFAGISSTSCFFTLMCTILGVICFNNFNKGLKNFLNAQQQLPGDEFKPVTPNDLEKSPTVQFPPPVSYPTFVATISNPNRYFPHEELPTAVKYEQMSTGSIRSIRRPPPARTPSNGPSHSQVLTRSTSDGSNRSTGSGSNTGPARTYAVAGSHHAIMAAPQRHGSSAGGANVNRGWVIE